MNNRYSLFPLGSFLAVLGALGPHSLSILLLINLTISFAIFILIPFAIHLIFINEKYKAVMIFSAIILTLIHTFLYSSSLFVIQFLLLLGVSIIFYKKMQVVKQNFDLETTPPFKIVLNNKRTYYFNMMILLYTIYFLSMIVMSYDFLFSSVVQ